MTEKRNNNKGFQNVSEPSSPSWIMEHWEGFAVFTVNKILSVQLFQWNTTTWTFFLRKVIIAKLLYHGACVLASLFLATETWQEPQ